MRFFYRAKQIILLAGDLASFWMGLWLALFIRHYNLPTTLDITSQSNLFITLFVVWLIINYINGLYDLARFGTKYRYRRLAESGFLSLAVSMIVLYVIDPILTPKTILLLSAFLGYSVSALWRAIYTRWIVRDKLHTRVIFVGVTPEINELITIMDQQPEKGYQPVALFDPEKKYNTLPTDGKAITVYHSLHALRPAVTTHRAHVVVVAPHLSNDQATLREMYELLFWPVRVSDLSTLYETITGRVPPSTFSESWFLNNLGNTERPLYTTFRSIFDYMSALFMGIFLIILTPIIAALIKATSRGPIFFGQERVGRGGQRFMMYKFRTMYALAADGSAEKNGAQFAEKNDARITPVGKFLRKTRLDELPQVYNLLRGNLSLIGPRPERPEIVEQLEMQLPYYTLRHMVRPGITGWAAIHQHYTDTMESSIQKLQYDLYYIKNRSLLLDFAILLRTINVVLRMMGQ